MIPPSGFATRTAHRPQGPSWGNGDVAAGWKWCRRLLCRGAPAAAVLLTIAAGCTGTADVGDRAEGAEPGEPSRPAASTTPPETPVATEPAPVASNGHDPRVDPSAASVGDCSFLEAMSDIEDSVFQVILHGTNGVDLGTAFYIGDGNYLTAAHVVTGHTSARLRNAVADFPATVIATDEDRDVALLQAGEPPGEALQLMSSVDVRPGQVVASVGYPLFEEYRASISGGMVSRLIEDRGFGMLIQTDAPINRGNSGGPLVDQCGRVVGMTIEKWFEEGVDGLAWAVASSSLEGVLIDARIARPPATRTTVPLTVNPTPETVPAVSPPARPEDFLGEVTAQFDDYFNRIEEVGRNFDSGDIDAATREQILWQLAVDTDFYRHVLKSGSFGLDDLGHSCDLARRTYARALGWTSRLAGYRAAQVRNPGEYESEGIEALERSRELAAEAANYRNACAGDR